jgi:isoleucyl-tRNA synthetase
MSVSDEILKRMADSYRRMRNTVRFLLGNLNGFDPKQHSVKPADMLALDRWALARTRELQAEITEAYRKYAFHLIYQKVHNFCIVDLGGFYLDVLKDRLYMTGTDSRARLSAQTAMFHIAESMVRWLAPILSFTAEEIWRFLPGAHSESVFVETWHTVPETPSDPIDWTSLIQLRSDVVRELEKLRNAGSVGSSLDAEVDVYCAPDEYARFNALGEELRFLFITSEARLHQVSTPPNDASLATNTGRAGVWITLKPSSDTKCVRCWHHRPDVGRYAEHPELCGRCVTNVEGPGEQRKYV